MWLLALAGCVTASGGAGSSIEYEDDLSILDVETDPRWLGALYEEAEGLEPTPVAAPDGSWTAQVLAAQAPRFNPEYTRVVIVPIGSSTSPVVCQLFETGVPVATVMRALATPVMQEGRRYEVKYLAVHARETPVMVAHGLSSGGPVSSGHIVITYVKVVAAIGPRGAAVCEHHRFGYRETVERVAVSLAQGLKWPKSARPSAVVEVIDNPGGPAQVRTSTRRDSEPASVSVFRTQLKLRGRGGVGAVDYAETFSVEGGSLRLSACVRRQDGDKQEAEGEAGRALGCGSAASVAAAQAVLTP